MATDSPWDSRWRSESHYQGHHYDPMQAPRPPAPAIGNQMSHNLPPSVDAYSRPWSGKSRGETEQHARGLPSMIDRYADASTYHSRLHERHTSPGRNSSLTNSPPRQSPNHPWHRLPVDHPAQNRNITETPLTLHIPHTQGMYKISSPTSPSHMASMPRLQFLRTNYGGVMTDLPRISTTYPAVSAHALESQTSNPQHPTSLPSFASFSEQASRTDDADEVEIAPMSARLSCYSCNKLTPLIREVAIAVAELDENVQQYCNKSVTRTLDFPKDSPIRSTQWILERLAKTKADLQGTARRMQSGYYYAHAPASFPGSSSQNISPPAGTKRPADRGDQEDLPMPKRPRSGASLDGTPRNMGNVSLKEDRRGSLDFGPRSPPPTESIPGSAYPKTGSPGLSSRPHRNLPSPSSLTYPPSAAPSLAPATAPSIGSPTTSYQPAVSIHTASASSATSAHIADLQHQVTLKSLSLQTLQREYATLLQKLQRESVKIQTIEKKTSVADQEVNDLTSKNEDLTEQIKALETQLEECEKKRESERITASKERDQWTKLLALDRQLQSKNAEEKQKLREERTMLSQRVAAYEGEDLSGSDQFKRSITSRKNATRWDSDRNASGEESDLTPAATTGGSPGDATNDAESLKHEIALLNNRIDVLRLSLEEAKRRSLRLGEKNREVVERNTEICSALERALEDDYAASATTTTDEAQRQSSATSGRSTPARPKSPAMHAGHAKSSRTLSESPNPQEPIQPIQDPASSYMSIASIARAVSPGPAELGFHVTPSTSSPEELISALGPVPAPLPPMHFASGYGSAKGGRRQRKQTPWVTAMSGKGTDTVQLGSFRPLTHHVSPPPTGMGRVIEYANTPHPPSSSPGSTLEYTSPGSSGSESRRSSEEDRYAANMAVPGPSTFTAGLPQPEARADAYGSFTMPPPPRPSMNLRDLCSIAAEPLETP